MSHTMLVLVFILGFFAGGICGWLANVKFSQNRKLQDDLTRTKRDLAGTRRSVDDFFKTSASLFEQLNRNYRSFAKFMNDSANKISTEGHEGFDLSQDKQNQQLPKTGLLHKIRDESRRQLSANTATRKITQTPAAPEPQVPALEDHKTAAAAPEENATPAAAAAAEEPEKAVADAETAGAEPETDAKNDRVEVKTAKENVLQ